MVSEGEMCFSFDASQGQLVRAGPCLLQFLMQFPWSLLSVMKLVKSHFVSSQHQSLIGCRLLLALAWSAGPGSLASALSFLPKSASSHCRPAQCLLKHWDWIGARRNAWVEMRHALLCKTRFAKIRAELHVLILARDITRSL